MSYIVDASVVIKWFVPESLHGPAESLLYTHGGDLEAPDFIATEIANIAWKKCIRKEITQEQAREIPAEACEYLAALLPSLGLIDHALDIALILNHPVYDCLYLACAESRNGIMVTADRRFFEAVKNTEFEGLVCCLDDPDLSLPLYISLQKIDRIYNLSKILEQTFKNIHSVLTEGMDFDSINTKELDPAFDSPAYHRLHSTIENLDEMEQVDVLALGWLGQGVSGTDWFAIRGRAEISIKSSDARFLRYVEGITVYLEAGLAILRKQQ